MQVGPQEWEESRATKEAVDKFRVGWPDQGRSGGQTDLLSALHRIGVTSSPSA
jgi:hypothetical protein